MTRTAGALRRAMNGPLHFVPTPFGPSGEVDLPRFAQYLEETLAALGPAQSLFVCCGVGEMWSLTLGEYSYLLGTAVDVAAGRAAIVAGVGYCARLATEYIQVAEAQSVDALLVFPPYMSQAPQEGLYRHYGAVADSSSLSLVLYHRAGAVSEPETVARLVEGHPNIIGIKDGVGDMDMLERTRTLLGGDLVLMNGMPTAELYQADYLRHGIRPYSPTALLVLPELGRAIDRALMARNEADLERLFGGFVRPLSELRSEVPGYGIALIKAALRLQGRSMGGVRPPLIDPLPEHEARLEALLAQARALIAR